MIDAQSSVSRTHNAKLAVHTCWFTSWQASKEAVLGMLCTHRPIVVPWTVFPGEATKMGSDLASCKC